MSVLRRRGFSLMEMVAVIAVLLVLAAIAVPSYLTAVRGVRANAVELSALAFARAIDATAATQQRAPVDIIDQEKLDEVIEADALSASVSATLVSGKVELVALTGDGDQAACIRLGTSTGDVSTVAPGGCDADVSAATIRTVTDLTGLPGWGYSAALPVGQVVDVPSMTVSGFAVATGAATSGATTVRVRLFNVTSGSLAGVTPLAEASVTLPSVPARSWQDVPLDIPVPLSAGSYLLVVDGPTFGAVAYQSVGTYSGGSMVSIDAAGIIWPTSSDAAVALFGVGP